MQDFVAQGQSFNQNMLSEFGFSIGRILRNFSLYSLTYLVASQLSHKPECKYTPLAFIISFILTVHPNHSKLLSWLFSFRDFSSSSTQDISIFLSFPWLSLCYFCCWWGIHSDPLASASSKYVTFTHTHQANFLLPWDASSKALCLMAPRRVSSRMTSSIMKYMIRDRNPLRMGEERTKWNKHEP